MKKQNQRWYGGNENDFHYNLINGLVLGVENILLKLSYIVFLIVINYFVLCLVKNKKVRRYNPVPFLLKNQKII